MTDLVVGDVVEHSDGRIGTAIWAGWEDEPILVVWYEGERSGQRFSKPDGWSPAVVLPRPPQGAHWRLITDEGVMLDPATMMKATQ